MNQSESITALAKALIAAQAELPLVRKDKTATTEKFSYDYVGLDTVMPAALKVLNKHGLGVAQPVGNGGHDGGATVTTMLIHESGEWISDTQPLILSKNDSQGQGSAITYARRYGLMAMIGMVADDDDDGAAASRRSPPAFIDHSEDPRPPAQQYAEDRAPQAPRSAESKYDGKCYVCGDPYFAGDIVNYKQVEGKWVRWHTTCDVNTDG